MLPPGVPPDRLAVLRKAFDDACSRTPPSSRSWSSATFNSIRMSGIKVQERVAAMLGVSSEVVQAAIAVSR